MTLTIDCVDGETSYSCTGSAKTLLKFIKAYDHEGSSLSLEVDGDHFYNPEVIYKHLKEEALK